MPQTEFGALGPALAIAAMALATYLCRISGVLLMSRVQLTPRVQRALAALPGSIVTATVVPIAFRSGPDGIAGILAGLLVMYALRNEVAALLVGLTVAGVIRAFVLVT